MNQVSWLSERDQQVVNRWIDDVRCRSDAKFVLVCQGGSTALADIRELLPRQITELNRDQLSHRMSHPLKSSRLYAVTSVPNSLQQSRLCSWIKQPGNGLVIFVEKFDQNELNWRDQSGLPLRHEVINAPFCEEDD